MKNQQQKEGKSKGGIHNKVKRTVGNDSETQSKLS